jgi:hypothetical protein
MNEVLEFLTKERDRELHDAKVRRERAATWRVADEATWKDCAALATKMSGRRQSVVPKAERKRLAESNDWIAARHEARAALFSAAIDQLGDALYHTRGEG